MNGRTVFALGLLLASVSAFSQAAASWPCADDLVKSEGQRVRISMGIAMALAERTTLPDVSDLKSSKIKSDVSVKLLVGKDGAVRCADAIKGDNELRTRSVDAAKKWQFRPYSLNGEAVNVETTIGFAFRKNKVSVLQPGK